MYIICVIDCMEDSRQDYPSSNRWISPRTIDLGRNSLRLWMRTSLNPWTNSPYETVVLLVQKAPETQSILEDPRNQGKTCARPRAMCAMLPTPQRRSCGLRAKAKAVTEQKKYHETVHIWGVDYNTLSPQPSSNGGTGFMFCLCIKFALYSLWEKWSAKWTWKKEIVSPSQYQKEQRTKYSKTKQKKHCKKTGHYNLKLSYHSSHEYRPCYVWGLGRYLFQGDSEIRDAPPLF